VAGWPFYRRLVQVADSGTGWSPGELRRLVREQSGLDFAALAPASGGESRTAFWATDRAGTVSVLKIMPGAGPEAVSHLRALGLVLTRLRGRGYPAPRFHAVGHAPGLVFWVQQRLPGSVVDHGWERPDGAALARLLPELLFYLYDHDDIRDLLRARLLALAGPHAARAYLAHMVLRQVDWSLRHHPTAPATQRHLGLARLITADIDPGPAH